MNPLVTLAIPTFRRPKYLKLALKCAIAQSYQNLEILISDDCSGDETAEIVRQFSAIDSRVRYRCNSTNAGLPLHFNQCLQEARGELFVIVSDDDLFSHNFVSELVEAFNKNPRAMVGITRCEQIDADGVIIEKVPSPGWETKNGISFLQDWLWGTGPCPVRTFTSMFIRTEPARRAGGFPDFPIAANSDNYLFTALALQGDIVYAEAALFQYRVYLNSCGLSMSYRGIAESSARYRDLMDTNPHMLILLRALTDEQRNMVRRGVSRMLAEQYFERISRVYAPKMTSEQITEAFKEYRADDEFWAVLKSKG